MADPSTARSNGTSYPNSMVITRVPPTTEKKPDEYQPARKKIRVGMVSRKTTTIRSPGKEIYVAFVGE